MGKFERKKARVRVHESASQIPPSLPTHATIRKNVGHDTWCPHPPCTIYTDNDRGPEAHLLVNIGQPINKPRRRGEMSHGRYA
jgi:hypothetical protein